MSDSTKTAIIYCSSNGSTRVVADRLRAMIGEDVCASYTTKDTTPEVIASYTHLIFGAPTYGMGDLDRRMQRKLVAIGAEAFAGKTVAFFVMGDQQYHGKTFAGGGKDFAAFFAKTSACVCGEWSAQGYTYEATESLNANNAFPCLVIDEVNQPEMTDARLKTWLAQLSPDFPFSL